MPDWEALPGETPIDDISGLKLKHIKTRGQLAVAEAENIRKAIVKYLSVTPGKRTAPFDLTWSFKLHREMFGSVWKWAGKPRQVDLNLGVPWHQVSSALQLLLDDLTFWKQHWPDVVEQAAHLHFRSAQIHPFLNGNGRWSRMLANIWLARSGYPVTAWPEETIGSVSTIRDEYLDAIRSADRGRVMPLIELHRKYSITCDDSIQPDP